MNKLLLTVGIAALATTQAMAASSPDKTFAKKAAQGGLAEVQVGQLAQQKATSPQVKEFAQTLVNDHMQANQELQQIAQGAGMTLREKALLEVQVVNWLPPVAAKPEVPKGAPPANPPSQKDPPPAATENAPAPVAPAPPTVAPPPPAAANAPPPVPPPAIAPPPAAPPPAAEAQPPPSPAAPGAT